MVPVLLAYFGPEAQLPLASVIAAISGFVILMGRRSARFVSGWVRRALGK